ncbi:MAG TPA: SDR family oxidoreductase [Geminicoccaceae bacterium]|jgi:NAD(P)-dependent dehydrogenase (short-subunit alcohol dehydrogenase family)|nr:SDR family oxidoreductase [Geminicoccaceae bacterium]
MSGVLLITGGSRGIGAATARLAAARGYAVAINYRAEAERAAALVGEIAAAGGNAVAVQADVARPEEVGRMFAQTDERLGRATALVNAAGINGGPPTRVADLAPAALERLMAVNVIGTMLCCREAVRRMSTAHGGAGGAILNVSSMAATIGGRPGRSAYATSKAAVDSFTVGLAKEVAREGIRVNAIRPGMTLTDMTDAVWRDPDRRTQIAATIAMNRCAEAEEIAQPILWLLSDQASFVSGAILDASGGGFMLAPVARS